ncbi:hypothetical protein [Amycolatopsis sp. NPDC050768]|uniref:hypothetical protein n=1 Tax=Amycolatopsis sp. NPDC050768 TaxID=3154839 RepID=UPI0033E4DC55
MIQTLRQRWNLGTPLTARDATAPDLAPILSRDKPRTPDAWPDVHPQPVPEFRESLVPANAPLSPLATALLHGYLALTRQLGQAVPDIPPDADLTGGQALDVVHETAGDLFPGLRMATAR